MSSVLEYTPIEEIPQIVHSLQKSFRTKGHKRSLDYRLNQLRSLYYALKDNEDLIIKSLQKDLNKSKEDIELLELTIIYSDLLHVIKYLPTWLKPQRAKDVNLLFKFSTPKITKIPLGTVLVISPFNFPLLCGIQPLIGAIAGGNTVIFKQSEQTPYLSQTVSNILTDALDPESFQIVNGGVEETTVLLDQKFDKIIYTGSGRVGRIIASKAAKNLTPVVLELGGKSPAFVTESVGSNLETVCKRIAFTRFTNAGQICVGTDYCVVHDSVYDEFVDTLVRVTKKLYNVNVENYTKIVNPAAWDRIMKLIRDTRGEVILGGDGAREERFIEPTIIKDVSFDDITMSDEIFGPVLPIIKYSDLQATIEKIVDVADTPLALYIYSTNHKQTEQISTQIRSGGLVVNDGMIHVGLSCVPFGGVGESGYGSYHGKWSLDTFTHERAVLKNPFWTEPLFESKYPPVSGFDLKLSKFFLVPKPTFGRTGRVRDHNYEFLCKVIFVGIVGVGVGFYYS